MNSITAHSLFSIYRFPTSRRVFVHNTLRKLADAQGLTTLVEHIDIALAFDTELLVLESKWRLGKPPLDVQPRDIDIDIDRIHGTLSFLLRRATNIFGDNSPVSSQAETLHQLLYPTGVAALIRQRHVDQLAHNTRVLEELASPAWETLLKDLGISIYVPKLRALNDDFALVLEYTQGPKPQALYNEVRAARIEGQNLLCETIAHILVAFSNPSPADLEQRDQLLAPLLAQNEHIGSYLRQRSAVPEVDPNTGQDQPPLASASSPNPQNPPQEVKPNPIDQVTGLQT